MADSIPNRKKVFISYVNADSEWAERLKAHLDDADSQGLVECWTDQNLKPGDNWQEEILNVINSAKIIILLLSPDYLASEYVANIELPIIKQAISKGLQILSIVVKPINRMYAENVIAETKFINEKPVSILTPREQELLLIEASKRIKKAILPDPSKKKLSSGLSSKVLASTIGGATIGGIFFPVIGTFLGGIAGGIIAAASAVSEEEEEEGAEKK